MSLKQFIVSTSDKTSFKQFQHVGALNRLTQSPRSGTAKIISIEDGKYNVEMADGTFRTVEPFGVRSVGPDGIIYLSGDLQII